MKKLAADQMQEMSAIARSWMFCLPVFNVKVHVNIPTIVLVVVEVLYGPEAWSLTYRKEHALKVLKLVELKNTFGSKGRRLQQNGESCIVRSFMICIPHQVSFDWPDQEGWDEASTGDIRNSFQVLVVRLEGRRPLATARRRYEDNLKWMLKGGT